MLKNISSWILTFSISTLGTFLVSSCDEKKDTPTKPNILLLLSDNHLWSHVGCYGDPVVKTPNIDALADQGIRFTHAFCSSPSCSPARSSILTGQDIWRLEEAANFFGVLPGRIQVYTDILESAGYHVGHAGKGLLPWAGKAAEAEGWKRNPAGYKYDSFKEFYEQKQPGQPFCFWYGSINPARGNHPVREDIESEDIAKSREMLKDVDAEKIKVPPYLPDVSEVKEDIAGYYAMIQVFDRDVIGYHLQLLKEMGELDNTLIVFCGDNGWQMPRGLANLYDFGTRVPLIVSMPSRYKGGRVIDDFVSLNDLAPTFLEIAGVPVPKEMNSRSLINILESDREGTVDRSRDKIVTARERHSGSRKNFAGYGGRAYRTKDFLYIRNYEHGNWPAGDPPIYGDVDVWNLSFRSPTKVFMLQHQDDPEFRDLFELGFGKRPAEELYDLRDDPFQMKNVAYQNNYKDDKEQLSKLLTEHLKENGDPRELGLEMKWIGAPFYGNTIIKPSEENQRILNLDESYSLGTE